MIAFSCSHCGMKLKVKPEFAGRVSRCPTCKQPLVVPAPSQTQANVAAGQIAGMDSSLAKAGVDGGVTLEQAAPSARPGAKSVRELLARRNRNDGRYVIEGEIARGGMGIVLRAVDCDIRREVAVKYLLDQADAKKKLRFVEEAQITGQLEHPNIVPIHELGIDALKRMFFAMKMVKGRSLAQVLDELRQHPKTAEKEYTLTRLLSILVNVCNALAYAHSRGVVHRDLKPANIMIGDFGEVYVMDWGLAKVGSSTGQQAGPPSPASVPPGKNISASSVVAVPPSQSPSPSRSSKVDTSREPDADLTQEGAVLGTPVYMPPEQATGRMQTIDQRSDVYSLGAILYEMLTLQPPIDKEGGYLAILMRVAEGGIVAPEQRNPQRAKAGKIPRELSAIAMKALAKNPQDRYANVEALRRDIERFQEGRSVSAKEDTVREAVWKLLKRNKAASLTAVIAVLVLTVVLAVNFRSTYKEQQTKRERAQKSAPLFFRDAKVSADRKEFDHALAQVSLAVEYDPDNVEARLLKGQLSIVTKDFAAAQAELGRYVQKRPEDKDAAQLLDLCKKVGPDDSRAVAFGEVFERQKAYTLAEQMEQNRDKLLSLYRKRIDAAWPGYGPNLAMDKDGKCRFRVGGPGVRDLTPLHGIPLSGLDLIVCMNLRDLTPLQGMPLTGLNLQGSVQAARDLTPLQGLPLRTLNLSECDVRDLAALKGLPLTSLSLRYCRQVTDLTPLQGMPLTALDLYACGGVRDLTPLKGLPLTSLDITACGDVRDLTPLQGMKLTEISFGPGGITKGMDAVRQMKSLKTIFVTAGGKYTPEEFWKKYDAGEFNK